MGFAVRCTDRVASNRMKTKTSKRRVGENAAANTNDAIGDYANAYSSNDASICRALRAEIDAALPNATSEIWHGSPVWFIEENPVVGYNVTQKHVNLLFWSGQSFGE